MAKAKAKRLWSTLAPSTKAKYKRYGVTPQRYNAGKISREFRKTIMGHGAESFAVQRAKQAGLDQIIPDFGSLPKRDRERMADIYLKGRTERIRPMTVGPRNTFELEALDANGRPLLNKDIMNAQMDLDEWWDKIGHGEMTDEDWKAFKLAYNASFTKH